MNTFMIEYGAEFEKVLIFGKKKQFLKKKNFRVFSVQYLMIFQSFVYIWRKKNYIVLYKCEFFILIAMTEE